MRNYRQPRDALRSNADHFIGYFKAPLYHVFSQLVEKFNSNSAGPSRAFISCGEEHFWRVWAKLIHSILAKGLTTQD